MTKALIWPFKQKKRFVNLSFVLYNCSKVSPKQTLSLKLFLKLSLLNIYFVGGFLTNNYSKRNFLTKSFFKRKFINEDSKLKGQPHK
jgi:hypothetical protein